VLCNVCSALKINQKGNLTKHCRTLRIGRPIHSTLLALVADAALQCVELCLQTSVLPLVVRALADEHEDQDDYDDDQDAASTADYDGPPAGHCYRRQSITSAGRVNVLHGTDVEPQTADTYLCTQLVYY